MVFSLSSKIAKPFAGDKYCVIHSLNASFHWNSHHTNIFPDIITVTSHHWYVYWGCLTFRSWSRHGNISVLLALCEGNPPVTGGFPSERPVTRRFDDFFDLRLNKRLSRQPKHRWFETQSHSLWRISASLALWDRTALRKASNTWSVFMFCLHHACHTQLPSTKDLSSNITYHCYFALHYIYIYIHIYIYILGNIYSPYSLMGWC